MSARRQVERAVGWHVDRIRALFIDHSRLAGAHPSGSAKLVRIVREEIFAGRDDGDVGAREPLKLPALCGEGDLAGDPSGEDLRHHLGVADRNLLFHGESEDSRPRPRGKRKEVIIPYWDRLREFYSRSHDAVIRVDDESWNVIETHEHAGDFKEW